jgi:hypothetical protein
MPYSQYYIAKTHLITANSTSLWFISLQPILICNNLSSYNQYYIDLPYLVTASTTWLYSSSLQPISNCYALTRYHQNHITRTYSITANTTSLSFISSQPTCYNCQYITIIYLIQPILIDITYLVTTNNTLP